MANSNSGQDSPQKPQLYDAQQTAILNEQVAQEKSERKAANQAFYAASHAPAQKNMSNTLDAGDFGGNAITVTPAPAQPKGRTIRKGK
jgi:hypothetical protein